MNPKNVVSPKLKNFILILILLGGVGSAIAQNTNYSEILTKSIQFYEAQICGEQPSWSRAGWRQDCHLDDGSYLGEDLTGGWHDAGDHVKFNYPMAQAITTLSWSYLKYNEQIQNSQNRQDMLNNLRLVGDFIIKCHPSPNVFYAQIASGDVDHSAWNSPEDDTYFRQVYEINPSSPGTDMACSMAAAFASLSMVFSDEDPQYSSELLQHARDLYAFGNTYRGIYTDQIDDGSFYDSDNYEDDLIWGALWLYQATNEQNWLTIAEDNYEEIRYISEWFPNWGDHAYGCFLLLSELTGKQIYLDKTEDWIENEIDNAPRTPGGLYFRNSFLSANSAAAMSFSAFYYAELRGESYTKYDKFKNFAQSQFDYILGDNPRNSSYLVGVGNNFPTRTHHQAAHSPTCVPFCSLEDPVNDTFELTGALIGGPDANDNFENSRSNFMESEMAVSNQSYFVGLAAQMLQENGGATGGEFDDDITAVTAPEIVTQGETVTIVVNYEASQNRDLIVSFELNENPYTGYAGDVIELTAGSGTVSVPITIPLNTPIAEDAYQFQVILAPTGGGFTERLDNQGVFDVDVTEFVSSLNDEITTVTGPESVTQGETIDLAITYEASQNRDLIISFELNEDPYTGYAGEVIELIAGSGTVNVPITIPSNTPIAEDGYQFQVILAPTGGGFAERLDNQGVFDVDVTEFVPSLNDEISTVTGPESVTQGETIALAITYEASQNRDLIISFEANEDPYTGYAGEVIELTAGSGTLNIPISIPLDTPIAEDGYQFQVILAPTGGGFTERLDNQAIFDVTVLNATISDNLALNAVTSQSTTAFGGGSGRAVDGNTSGDWGQGSITHTTSGAGQWWSVNLGGTYEIGDINIWNRTNCCSARLDNITVTVEDSGNTILWSQNITSSSAETLEINAGGVLGSVIRITQNQNQPLSLAEVQVYAFDGETPPITGIFPDPDKTYYIDAPTHNLRLAASGESEDAYTAPSSTIGSAVEWKFVAKGNGSWHIQKAAGGSKPRLRTRNNGGETDMQPTSSSGTWTYWDLTTGFLPNSYFLTLPNGPGSLRRLQVDSGGGINMVSTAANQGWESFRFTEVDTKIEATNIFIEAEDYTDMDGVQIENTTDTNGGQNVGYINANDWMEYAVDIPNAGTHTMNFRVASAPGNATVNITSNGTLIGTFNVGATGGWQSWITVTAVVNLPAGSQDIRLASTASGWNINWLELLSGDTSKGLVQEVEIVGQESSALAALDEKEKFSVYPVPTQGMLNVALDDYNSYGEIVITDLLGRSVITNKTVEAAVTRIDLSQFQSGIYLLKILDKASEMKFSKKIVIE